MCIWTGARDSRTNGSIFYLHYDTTIGVPTVTRGWPTLVDPDYVISDTSPQNEPSARVLQLHVVGAGNLDHSFKTFLEDKGNVTCVVLFPPFSREEHLWCKGMRNATGIWTSQEELQLRYDVFGGSIRLLHAREPPSHVPVELQQFAYKELITFFKNVNLGGWSRSSGYNQFANLFVELRRIFMK
jgi:hypothetical protein